MPSKQPKGSASYKQKGFPMQEFFFFSYQSPEAESMEG